MCQHSCLNDSLCLCLARKPNYFFLLHCLQTDGKLDTTSLALFWQCAKGAKCAAPLSAGANLSAGLQRGEAFLQRPQVRIGAVGKEETDAR
jgi:hypothetical protein